MTDRITPKLHNIEISLGAKAYMWGMIFLTSIILFVMALVGAVIIVPIGLLFTHKIGTKNEYGWQMERLHNKLWPWSNDYDGVQGQKNGKNKNPFGWALGSYLGNWWWTAIRNPVNNWNRYYIGVDYNQVTHIAKSGNWLIAVGDGKIYPCYRYKNFLFGWKVTESRAADRPWCGFSGIQRITDQSHWNTK